MINFVFDVDGTLTPSRLKINYKFRQWFLNFVKNHCVSLVTGSDAAKTIEQIGHDIFDLAHYSFNCLGNEVYSRGKLVYQNKWSCPTDLLAFLQDVLATSAYPTRTGNHFETRTGMINFSVPGRNSSHRKRKKYHAWDCEFNERIQIVNAINNGWSNVHATVGGEISIDIAPVESNKAQILAFLKGNPVYFFGDRCNLGGNDYELAQAIKNRHDCRVFCVKDWKETWNYLKQLTLN